MEGFVVCLVCVIAVGAIELEEFYPYNLSVNEQLIANDDASSRTITLDPPLMYYGRSYNECMIHNNGLVTLNKPPEHFLAEPFPLQNYTFIAPFYGDVDTRRAGTVWFTYPATRDPSTLKRAADDIRESFKNTLFSPAYLIIATWDHVGYFKEKDDKLNTFQCVVASDGNTSFAIFLYNETQWTSPDGPNFNFKHAKVGFNEGYQMKSWEIPCSMTSNLTHIPQTSNVGVPGKWIFLLDEEMVSPCPDYAELECNMDQFCSCLTSFYQQNCQCKSSSEDTCLYTMQSETPTAGSAIVPTTIGCVLTLTVTLLTVKGTSS